MTTHPEPAINAVDARRITEQIKVNAEAELAVVDMTAAEAEAVTAQIRAGLTMVWEKVADAYRRRAWVALSYDSWDEYCGGEFGASRVRIPQEERHEVMSSLRDEGLSQRAIAAATGTSARTVRRDLSGGANAPPPAVPGTDVTTGLDGKTYVRPAPPPARRRPPLPNAFWNAVFDLKKATARLERLAADDRVPEHATLLAANHGDDLAWVRDTVQAVLDHLA